MFITCGFSWIQIFHVDFRSLFQILLSVRSLSLFGSAVREEASEGSDLDFVVELEELTFDNYMDLKFFLEDLFDCNVDLVIKEDIKPLLRQRILEEMVHVPGI